MGMTFVNQSERSLNAVAIVLNRTFLSGRPLIAYPPFKLMRKGGGVRTQHHANTQPDLVPYRLSHVNRVPV